MKIIKDLEVPVDEDLEEKLEWLQPNHGPYRILKQSIDARRRHTPHFVYSIEIADFDEKLVNPIFDIEPINSSIINSSSFQKPIIVGTGPAGLFAALRLIERGIPSIIFERGSESEKRILGINRFWRYGELDPRNNVCYGEGGAGLYSDGKLITRIKSPFIPYVLNRLVQFGAPKEIEWLSNPHVGSDRIRRIIPKLREYLKQQGCLIHYNTQVKEILCYNNSIQGIKTEYEQEFLSPFVVLATGHSAEDMIMELEEKDVKMEGKSFALGLRIEHPQTQINKIQFRDHFENSKLGAANYRLAHHDKNSNTGVYSFCMCPGGFVLSSGTESDGIVCNGMSNYNRNSQWANAAIVVSVDHSKHFGKNILGGLKMRREIESRAFRTVRQKNGTKELPGQKLTDFLNHQKNPTLNIKGSSPSGIKAVDFHEILDDFFIKKLKEGFEKFNNQMNGYVSEEALLYGVESRTSCPVRILRDDKTLESLSHSGLFPTGEGAGYAGGITSAACDGIRVAEKIYEKLKSQSHHLMTT